MSGVSIFPLSTRFWNCPERVVFFFFISLVQLSPLLLWSKTYEGLVGLCVVLCVVFFFFFFDPVSCIASVSGLSILDCPFGFLWCLFRITERLLAMDIVNEKRQVRSPLSFARRDYSHYHPLLMELSTIFRVREGMSNFRLFCYGVYIFTVCSIPN